MRLVVGIFIGVLAAATLVAQDPPAAQDTPTFRSGVQLIEVDAVVTDRDGRPVRDLTIDDFEIIEERKPQTIRTFSFVDLPYESKEELAARRADDVEPDVVTNTHSEARTYVLFVDVGVNLRARHIAEQWLNEVVQPGDRVAIVHADGTYKDGQTFTTSRRLLLDSINRMLGSASAARDTRPAVTRYLRIWENIKEIAEKLGTVEGRRKAIIWLTGGVPPLHGTGAWAAGQGSNPDPFAEAGASLLAAWKEAADAAANNNVAIYPVDPAGLQPEALGVASLIQMAGFREVAEETGGIAVGVNSNSFSDGFANIVQDASTYYLLGYSPEREYADGEFHPITVRVKREGVTVRARRGYYAPSATAKPPKQLPTPPEGVSLAARDALRLPVATKGLDIDVTTTAFKGTGKDASVVVTAHVRGQTLELDRGRRLAVSYQVFDVEGKVVTGFYKVFGFNLGDESKARATGTGLQFVERISLKPGRYELRLVAEQLGPSGAGGGGGPIGSVVAPLEAGKFDDKLELSGVALASRRANEVLLVGDRGLRGVLPDDPTALRTFRATDGLSAYAEVYTGLDDSRPGIRYDIINAATLTSAIATPAGAVVARGQVKKVVGDAAGKSLREGFRTDFDLAKLTPGMYVLTLEARAGRSGKDAVTRKIPFTVE